MKNQTRKHFKDLRDKLEVKDLNANSQAILKKITSCSLWHEARTIMCYISFGKEVKTRPIIEKAWQDNKQVIIPVCKPSTKEIIPSLLTSFEDLEPRTMGIMEPKDGKLNPVDPKKIELALIPGVAFDLKGRRIGFGAGYYDRFLPLLKPDTPKVALAHEIQVSSTPLPDDEYDIRMDYICTEKGLYEVNK
ncbi:MAG: 5-formyltetrahydrofolate cyclo-ligase [Clostridia bacterium]|nr:5-formyltetrahydrofolate cyclo-ligase [Clostridia bacterium]